MHYSKNTVKNYAAYLRTYLNNNKKQPHAPKGFYEFIDECKRRHEAILTPSKSEEVGVTIGIHKDVLAKKSSKANDTFGVLIDNTIKVFKSEDACKAYMDCYKEFKDDNIEAVKITITKI